MTDPQRPTDPMPGEPTAPPATTPPTAQPVPAAGAGTSAAFDTDATATPVATQPITAPPSSGMGARASRTRMFVAAGLIALVVGATALITLSLTAAAPQSTVLGYVPADSTMYGEVRLDLPGDQRQKVGQFLSKFPGFADQAALESKLDEVLDRLTTDSTGGKQHYTSDIKPWFDGQIAFALGPIPTVTSTTDPAATVKQFRALLLVSVKDAAKAKTWLSSAMSEAGATGTTEQYAGSDLTVFSDPKLPGVQAGFATVDGKVAIVGDLTSLKAAIDTKGSSGLAKTAGFAAADAALKGDDVGFVFIDMKSVMAASMRMQSTFSSAPPMSDELLAMLPEWVAARLRVENDALVMDGVIPHSSLAASGNHANGVAAYAPASTLALFANNDYGAILKKTFEIYRKEPSTAQGFKQIDDAAGIIGGLDNAVDWMGDSGVVIAKTGDTIEGGIVSIPADAAAAKQLLTQVKSFIALGGAQAGVSSRDETYNGQTITIVDLGSLANVMAMAGSLGGMPVDPNPSTAPGGSDAHAELAYVATDQVVIVGSSPDFVKHALDAGAGASLAKDPRFQGLLGRVDANHAGVAFLDITGIRAMLEAEMAKAPANDRAQYERDIKPFLTPFDALIGSGSVGSSVDQSRYVITVK